jgi:hypothetical protein
VVLNPLWFLNPDMSLKRPKKIIPYTLANLLQYLDILTLFRSLLLHTLASYQTYVTWHSFLLGRVAVNNWKH